METKEFFTRFYQLLAGDRRLTVWHIGLLMAICYSHQGLQAGDGINISRRRLMELTHIHSRGTYHRCIRDLRDLGYIHYQPSFNPRKGSTFRLLAAGAGA